MTYYTLHSRPGARDGRWDMIHSCERCRWAAFSHLCRWVIAAVVDRYVERRRLNELRSLSDRSLKDLGLHRSEAMSVVRNNGDYAKERRHVSL